MDYFNLFIVLQLYLSRLIAKFMNKLFFTAFILISAQLFAQNKAIDSLSKILPSRKDTFRVNTLVELSKAHRQTSIEKAIAYANEAIQYSEKISFKKGLVVAYNTLGNTYVFTGTYPEALAAYQNADKNTDQSTDKIFKATLINNIGNVYYFQANYQKALEFYFKSLKMKEELKQEKGAALTLNNIGAVYYDQKNYEKAKEMHKRALEIRTRIKDLKGISDSYNNLGLVAKMQKEYSKSIEYFETSIETKTKLNDLKGKSNSINNLGTVYELLKNYDKANQAYAEALEIRTKLKDRDGIVASMLNLSNILLLKNDLNKAEEMAFKLLKIAQEINANERIMKAYLLLSEIHHAKKEFQKAYDFHLKYAEINEKLFNENQTKQIAEMQAKYETEKKNLEIELLKTQKNNLLLARNAAVVGVFLLAVLTYLLYARFKLRSKLFENKEKLLTIEKEKSVLEKERIKVLHQLKEEENLRLQEQIRVSEEMGKLMNEKLQTEIDYKKRELSSSTMLLAQKNQILATIKDEIEKVEITDKKLRSQINGITKQITENIELDEDWNLFKMHFESVHQNFFNSLLELYPSLTPNEQKHCAYIKMNLTVKEVGRLLGVNGESVQMTRYRLKKKMKLPTEDNLNDHILALS